MKNRKRLQKLTLATLFMACALVLLPRAEAQQGVPGTLVQQSPTDLAAVAVAQNFSTAGGTGTITITPPAGLFVYVLEIDGQACNGTAVTATSGFYTTTGLSGTPKWQANLPATAQLCGSGFAFAPSKPFKSNSAGTNVTIVTPTGVANATWNMNVFYYYAP